MRGAFLAAAALLLLQVASFASYQIDDAFIVLRYAQNLARGKGLVFNPGERVEGFTSPALVMAEATAVRAGLDGVVFAKMLGTMSALALLALALRFVARTTRDGRAVWLAGAFLAAQPALASGAANGLETVPFALCAFWGFERVTRDGPDFRGGGALWALATYLRPEGAFGFGLALAGSAIVARDRRAFLRGALQSLAVFAALVLPGIALRYWYFGELVPNTALAKIAVGAPGRIESGFRYLIAFSTWHVETLAVLALLVCAVREASLRPATLFTAGWIAYVVWTGGDWIPHGRFLVPVVPFLALGTGAGVSMMVARLGRRQATLAAGVVAAVVLAAHFPDWAAARKVVLGATESARRGREPLGRWLGAALEPDARIAMLDVGAVAALSDRAVIDTGGLTDRAIARIMHESHGQFVGHLYFPDLESARAIASNVLARRPEVVVLLLNGKLPELLDARRAGSGPGEVVDVRAAYPQDLALLDDPSLRRGWRWECAVADYGATAASYNVFVRKDVIRREGARVDGLDCR